MLRIVFFGITILLISTLALFPIENLFVTFNSPESVFNYYHFGNEGVDLVVEGDNCDFVIGKTDDSDTFLIIPKNDDGWKVGSGVDTRKAARKFSNGISITVYKYKNTNDYFITVFDSNGGISSVSDKYNTEFYYLEKDNDSLGKKYVTYYAHISDFGPQYSISVNGNEITIQE